MNATDPNEREYLAAVSYLPEHTPSPVRFRAGDEVMVPRVFGSGYQDGVVYGETNERRYGRCYLVDTAQGRLLMLPDEIAQRTAGQRS